MLTLLQESVNEEAVTMFSLSTSYKNDAVIPLKACFDNWEKERESMKVNEKKSMKEMTSSSGLIEKMQSRYEKSMIDLQVAEAGCKVPSMSTKEVSKATNTKERAQRDR